MRIYPFILIIFISCFIATDLKAQVPNEEEVRKELEEKGITEAEIKERLLEKGIDLDEVDVLDPVAALEAERAIRETINELLAEKEEASEKEAEEENKEEQSNDEIPRDTLEMNELEIQEEKIDQEEEKIELEDTSDLIYGQHIFKNKAINLFNQSDQIKTSDSYILGTGDEIGVSIWGQAQYSQTYIVDSEGYISPDDLDRIYLKGISYGDAKELLSKRFRQIYVFNKNEFKATIASERELIVNISGEVEQPGAFNISSKNTAVNALIAAGGPTEIGSVRKIKVLKPGVPEKILDVYKYLNDPLIGEGFYLENNDVIHVPVIGQVVSLEGAVIRPRKYELIEGEGLLELFEIAGGFKSNAVLQNIQIKRFRNDKEEILDVNLNELMSTKRKFPLVNGDVVIVNEIQQEFTNFVELKGAISSPGKFAIGENSKLRDVLNKVQILPEAITEIASIKRLNPDGKSASWIWFNLEDVLLGRSDQEYILKPRDEVQINSQARFTDDQSFSVEGAVREPGEFQIDNSGSIRFSQAIFLAGGLRADADNYAYIFSKKYKGSNQTSYRKVNLEKAFENTEEDVFIKNGDVISVYSSLSNSETVTVTIDGAVSNPGEFVYDKSLSLKDIISLAGGFKITAAPYKIEIYRVVFDDRKKTEILPVNISVDENFETSEKQFIALEPFDLIYVREAPEFELHKTVTIEGEVKYKGKYPILNDNEKLSDIIARAGGLTDEAFAKGTTVYRDSLGGYVVNDLELAMDDYNSPYNLVLQAGDVISVPKTSNIVTIIGETRAKDLVDSKLTNNGVIHAPYQKGKSARYYIDEYAGGIGENGKSNLVTVTFPTGEVITSSRVLFFTKSPEVRPGSVIKIGSKNDEVFQNENKVDTDWGKVLTDSVAQATAILSLILLVQRL